MPYRKSNKFLWIMSVVILRLLLDVIYLRVISPQFAYAGLGHSFSTSAIIYSWLIMVGALLIVLPCLDRKDFFLPHASLFLFLLFFVPWTSFVSCKPQKLDFLFCETVFWYMTFLLLHKRIHFNISRSVTKGSEPVVIAISLVMMLTVVYISAVYAHFRMKFDLVDVYDLRMEAREYKLPTIIAYLWAATSNVLPILMIYFVSRKRWWMVSIMALVVVMNFSINGSKSTFFKLFLCFLFYFFANNELKHKIPMFLAAFVGLGIVEFSVFHSGFIADVIVRRSFYVTSLLDSYYYDLINQFGPAVFSHKVAGHDVQFYIGELYFGRDSMRANNGMFSDAYMNLGWLGCFVYPVLYMLFFNVCEHFLVCHKPQIKWYAVFLMVLTMRSSEFTTTLLTHGMLLLFLTMMFMPRERTLESNVQRKLYAPSHV